MGRPVQVEWGYRKEPGDVRSRPPHRATIKQVSDRSRDAGSYFTPLAVAQVPQFALKGNGIAARCRASPDS